MINPKQLFLIGGGSSIQDGLKLGLWEKLKDKFTIGTNFSYKFFSATAQVYVDAPFYDANASELSKLPLILGTAYKVKQRLPNTCFFTPTNSYTRDLSDGVYSPRLSGIYALSLAVCILDSGTIFLLGYDMQGTGKDEKNRAITHFYQGQVEHGGVGKINYYDIKNRSEIDFGVFRQETKVKIYNVSPNSRINCFEKINYEQMFKLMLTQEHNQETLREEIKSKLSGKYSK
jgi:hypothetical protein